MIPLLLAALSALTPSCSPAGEPVQQPDVLVVVLDDLSQRELEAYAWRWPGEKIPTPTLDSFARTATTYGHVSSMPLCSPTRGSLMTALYPFRTGIGNAITLDELGMDPDTPTLADWFAAGGYATALVGKWHLADHSPGLSGPPHPWDHPGAMGWDAWRACRNVGLGAGDGYYDWTRVDDGTASQEPEYATTAMVDAFIEWEAVAASPWFAVLSLNAPHGPYEDPPAELLPPGWPASEDDRDRYVASVVAADAELARALEVVPPDAVVVIMSDNGTPKAVKHPLQDADQVKGSLHLEGVEVPFLVRGPGNPPATVDRTTIASVVDVGPTLLQLAGLPVPPGLDGGPGGAGIVYAERFNPQGFGPYDVDHQSARGPRYKLRREDGVESFFDLQQDPAEQTDLLPGALPGAAQRAYDELATFLDTVRDR